VAGDRHPELPIDPDAGAVRPLHLHPAAVLAVGAGGLLGAAARYGLVRAWPVKAHGWPTATFTANLAGALVLGILLEALARRGPDTGRRRQIRLFAGTGFCGAFTTFSSLAVESDLLIRSHDRALAVGYLVASVLAGVLATAAGIALAARFTRPGADREALA
jgi:CrcB protein